MPPFLSQGQVFRQKHTKVLSLLAFAVLVVGVAYGVVMSALHWVKEERLKAELAEIRDLIDWDDFRPSAQKLDAWLNEDDTRERVRRIAMQHADKSSLHAWIVLVAAKDSRAVRQISQRILEIARKGGDPICPMGLSDHIMVLHVARNPDAKHILWRLILDPATKRHVYRHATNVVQYLSADEDLPKLIKAVKIRIAQDSGYVRLARSAAETMLDRSWSGNSEGEMDVKFLEWIKSRQTGQPSSAGS